MNTIRRFLHSLFFIFLTILSVSCRMETDPVPPNILFIAVDDLRPELNCFGRSYIHSPNIDKIASEGIIFERAYCQVPVCGASRASLLTGIRPNVNRFLDYATWADEDVPEALSLPLHFKNHGYYTLSRGKIFHHKTDKIDSWSEPPWLPVDDLDGPKFWRDYQLDENQKILLSADGAGPAYEKADVPDNAYFDGKIADRCIEDLRKLKELGQPFFLAAGFFKPHLPFNAPSKYWDLYDPAQITLPDNPHKPENAPAISMHNFGELRAYTNIPPTGALPDSLSRKLIHGYYACVSFTDAQIGKVLTELENLDLDKNTIVILWGDHGWNLGEHGLWCKHCNYETSLRAPIILKVPWKEGNVQTKAMVEFVDIYPTLCEAAGLDIPGHVQGESMLKYLDDPDLPGKSFVFSRWHKGESVKSSDYRYTEWMDSSENRFAEMLYDHRNDYAENYNIAPGEQNGKVLIRHREANLLNRIESEKEINGKLLPLSQD